MENPFDWTAIIYGIGVLLLISPMIAMVLRAPNTLRNATIWLALVAALGWGYKYFGYMLPNNVAHNMERGGYYHDDRQQPAKPEGDASKLSEDAANDTAPAAKDEDNPIRNP